MGRFSAWSLATHALTGHGKWESQWRDAAPRGDYDAIVVGGGAHGLATAYYLARNHGIRRVAVLERGWIGGGNAGRNTTIVRANYLLEGNEPFYEFSLRLWEGLEAELNYNVMVSQRGVLNLHHSDAQRDADALRGNSIRLHGSDAELLSRREVQALCPYLNFNHERFPIEGGLLQRRAGTVRHDAVVWGYARAASALGVDIVQNCEVQGFLTDNEGAIVGVESSRGSIRAPVVGISVAGNSSTVASAAGLRLPIESHVLQAFVTEAVKPILPMVVTYGMGHLYASQSNKGGVVFGGDLDGYNSYAQRGNLPVLEDTCHSAMELLPMLGRLRILRGWGGTVDMSMDGSPIIDTTGIPGLYLNAGWCYGGFKATPAAGWSFAHLLATGERHEVARAYRLDRFERGAVLDEKGQGPQPNLH